MAMTLGDLDPGRCQPGGHPLICGCGAALRHVPTENGQDWKYVDDQGHSYVDQAPPLLRENPERWWANLLAANPGGYSALSAAINLGWHSWLHPHYPQPCPPDPHRALDVPYHCGEPMWLAPYGWRCRTCKEAP